MRSVRAAVVVLVALGVPFVANAACMSSWVTFSEVAPGAPRVVIGSVANAIPLDGEADGYASVFSVDVEEVLRGPGEPVVAVHEAVNNPVCGALVMARNGDRIALAMGGTALGSHEVTSIAYLAGIAHRSDIEKLSRAEVYSAAAVELPDTAGSQPRRPAPLGWLLVGIAAILVLAWRRPQPDRLA